MVQTTVIFTPDAHVENLSVDGKAAQDGVNSTWATIRGAAGNYAVADGLYAELCTVYGSATVNQYATLYRAIFCFYTSLPVDANILSAILALFGNSKTADYQKLNSVVVSSAPAADTNVVAGDFDSLGNTPLSTVINYDDFSIIGYNNFALNAAGIAAINAAGVTHLGVKSQNCDVDNVAPTYHASVALGNVAAWCAEKGDGYKPKLAVTMTTAVPVIDATFYSPFGGTNQRYTFYANGRYWVFYCNGYDLLIKTSTDGINFSISSILWRDTNMAGWEFCVVFDGTYFHYVRTRGDATSDVFYRMGTPNADGTVTWAAAEQTVWDIPADREAGDPTIVVDSNGYPWIGIAYQTVSAKTALGYVTKSKTKNGTWTTENVLFTAPYKFSDSVFGMPTATTAAWPTLVPLTNGKMFCIVQGDGHNGNGEKNIKGRLWDGAAWAAEETCVTSNEVWSACVSAAAVNDNVHFTYNEWVDAGHNNTRYIKRTYTGSVWSAPVTVRTHAVTNQTQVVLTVDAVGNLYCFWVDEPTAKHIYYKVCSGGTWSADPIDVVTDPDDLSDFIGNLPTIADKVYNGKILFGYATKLTAPYVVKYLLANPLGAPTVASISPSRGAVTGGTPVTITGTGFVDGATVTFNGCGLATSVVFVSATELTAVTPAGVLGPVDVIVTNPDSQYGVLAGGYTYSIKHSGNSAAKLLAIGAL